MNLLRSFINSISELTSERKMESEGSTSVVSERVVLKLKAYFDLAKVEIDKAVRAEEWGLNDDAINHYRNALRIMLEAKSARVPDPVSSSRLCSAELKMLWFELKFGYQDWLLLTLYLSKIVYRFYPNSEAEACVSKSKFSFHSTIILYHFVLVFLLKASNFSSEHNQVKTYQQKIAKWQGQVSERLQVLSQRAAGGNVPKKGSNPNTLTTTVSSSTSRAKKDKFQNLPSFRSNNLPIGNKKDIDGSSKSTQKADNNYDTKLVEIINTAIVDRSPAVKWEDVAGLDKAKQALLEMVILPTKRRDLFTGLRKPARGLLLFGPPGNGKTMLAKAVASESDATFFNISASSLTSKWVGEAEKLVRTLFMVAVSKQPSVIFMDEIDSILSTRLNNENDSSRKLKSEFLVQFDGVCSNPKDLVIVIGATNKPQELDDAVLRRLVKRIYVPLPDDNVRKLLLKNQLKGQEFSLPGRDMERLVKDTEGYSGSDLQALCEEAAMMPIRELGPQHILTIKPNQLRPLKYEDFKKAMVVIRPSLQRSRWEELERWNEEFGSN